MRLRSIALTVVLTCAMTVNAAAANTLTPARAGGYIGSLMEYILNNYVGRDLTAEELYYFAAKGMTNILDEFSDYMSADEFDVLYDSFRGNFEGIGIEFSMLPGGEARVNRVFDNSPAKTAGLMPGDIITKVNTVRVNGYDANALAQLIADATGKIRLEALRDGAVKTFVMEKAEVHMPTVEYGVLGDWLEAAKADKTVGYVRITSIGEYTADELAAAVTALKAGGVTGLVMDFRGNPGGLKNVIDDISQMFVPKGVVYSTVDAAGNKEVYRSRLGQAPFARVAIIVDGNTASACELFTAAMQDAKAAVVVGSKTYGKGIIQSFAQMPDGGVLKYTSMEYLRRSGERLHGIGITPDITVTKPQPIDNSILLMNNDGTGDGVANLKSLLKYMGYTVELTNARYDDATAKAVADLQQLAGLNPTGTPDLQTVMAINAAYNDYTTANDAELAAAYKRLGEIR